jgi:hypothetical protein
MRLRHMLTWKGRSLYRKGCPSTVGAPPKVASQKHLNREDTRTFITILIGHASLVIYDDFCWRIFTSLRMQQHPSPICGAGPLSRLRAIANGLQRIVSGFDKWRSLIINLRRHVWNASESIRLRFHWCQKNLLDHRTLKICVEGLSFFTFLKIENI